MSASDLPVFAVLWERPEGWSAVWLGDDSDDAEREAAVERPALMPGVAHVATLHRIER